ncbi:MAG: glycosyltransferase [Planctomycetota bacterium]
MKLLVISPDFPFPENQGFRIRVVDLARALAPHVEQHLLVYGDVPASAPFEPFARVTAVARVEPSPLDRLLRRLRRPLLDHPSYTPKVLREAIAEVQEREDFDACLVHTPLLAGCFRALPATVRRWVDAHDLWYEKYACLRALGCGELLEHCRDREAELRIYRSADLTLAISLHDHEQLLRQGVAAERLVHTPVSFPARPIPNEVDAPVLFYAAGTGQMNEDAIHYFVDQVLPRVRQRVAGARLHVLGAGREIRRAFSAREGVVLLPYVDDVAEAYAAAKVVVVPLRYGTGLKIKVLEAFSFGRPTVLSDAARQGVALGDYPQHDFSIAPEAFAQQVVRALEDRGYRSALAASGLRVIREHYSRDAAYGGLLEHVHDPQRVPPVPA